MTNTEISRRLALAIGYTPDHIDLAWGVVRVWHDNYWHLFDRRDERVIFRIAARFKLFPQLVGNEWHCYAQRDRVINECPATCIALAVIEASERGLLS